MTGARYLDSEMEIFDALNDVCISLFGETVTLITVSGVFTAPAGVFSDPVESASLGNFDFREILPTLSVPAKSWEPTGGKEGDTIIRKGIRYVIAHPPEKDPGNMYKITLRKQA